MKKDDIGEAFAPIVMCYAELDSITSKLEERMQDNNTSGRSTLILCLNDDDNKTVLNFLDLLLESTGKTRADLLESSGVLNENNPEDLLSDIVRLKIITTYAKVILESSAFKDIHGHSVDMSESWLRFKNEAKSGGDDLLDRIVTLVEKKDFLHKHDGNLINIAVGDYINPFVDFVDILEKVATDINYSDNFLKTTKDLQKIGLFKTKGNDSMAKSAPSNSNDIKPVSPKK